jgi:hypothetical protein
VGAGCRMPDVCRGEGAASAFEPATVRSSWNRDGAVVETCVDALCLAVGELKRCDASPFLPKRGAGPWERDESISGGANRRGCVVREAVAGEVGRGSPRDSCWPNDNLPIVRCPKGGCSITIIGWVGWRARRCTGDGRRGQTMVPEAASDVETHSRRQHVSTVLASGSAYSCRHAMRSVVQRWYLSERTWTWIGAWTLAWWSRIGFARFGSIAARDAWHGRCMPRSRLPVRRVASIHSPPPVLVCCTVAGSRVCPRSC